LGNLQKSFRLAIVCLSFKSSFKNAGHCLQETNVGKVVNSLRKNDDEDISSKAKAIVQKWRDVVQYYISFFYSSLTIVPKKSVFVHCETFQLDTDT
jgi:TFIIS helical bundle-like domain